MKELRIILNALHASASCNITTGYADDCAVELHERGIHKVRTILEAGRNVLLKVVHAEAWLWRLGLVTLEDPPYFIRFVFTMMVHDRMDLDCG